MGITSFAAKQLGDIVHVDLPRKNTTVSQGASVVGIESVKTAADVYAPSDCVVLGSNAELENAPELLNESPDTEGWLAEVKFDSVGELDSLMDQAAYDKFCEEQGDD